MQEGYCLLNHRTLISVTGEDARDFLQGILTNDVDFLEEEGMIYACLLTPQGKFLFEFFIQKTDNGYILDCEKSAAQDILKKLKLYKIRKKVTTEHLEEGHIYAVLSAAAETEKPLHQDTRHKDAGFRMFCTEAGQQKIALDYFQNLGLQEVSFDAYDQHRIRLGLPDGSRDMLPEYTTMAEARIDQIGGVSFEKGCYVGQELTARMRNRGLAKKHILPIQKISLSEQFPASREAITDESGKTIGEMRSSSGHYGMALIRHADIPKWQSSKRFKLVQT